MQRGKNSASPIPGRFWSQFSAGLGLAACTPPRVVMSAMLVIAIVGQILAVT